MKRLLLSLLTLVANPASGQDSSASPQTFDLQQTPLLESQNGLGGSPKNGEASLFALPLLITAEGCSVSTTGDTLVVWGRTVENTDNSILLVNLTTGETLMQRATDLQIKDAQANSTDVYVLTNAEDNVVRLARTDLSEVSRFRVGKSFRLINDRLLYSESDGACFALPDFKKVEFAPQTTLNRPENEPGYFTKGFLWRGFLWNDDFKPQLMLNPPDVPKFHIGLDYQIKTELVASGEVLFSSWKKGSQFNRKHLVPVVRLEDDVLQVMDPATLEPLTTLKLNSSMSGNQITSFAASKNWLFFVFNGRVCVVPSPKIPTPKFLEPKQTAFVIKHQSTTTLTYQAPMAKGYRLEISDLPYGCSPRLLNSTTGDFQIEPQTLLKDIYAVAQKHDSSRVRSTMDRTRKVFEFVVGRPPKGVPYLLRFNVAALQEDLSISVLSHGCFIEIPVSKHMASNISDIRGVNRNWTTANGKSFRAILKSVTNDSVELLADGSELSESFAVSSLSDFDRAWLGIAEFEPKID